MEFVKVEGLGNDFVLVEGPRRVMPAEVAAWCDRRRGIGADGVLVATRLEGGRVGMEYWNADGSAAEMCGNGLRCVARYSVERGWVDRAAFTVETSLGSRKAEVAADGTVTVQLTDRPVVVGDALEVGGVSARPADVGNPHAVVFVDDPAATEVADLGRRIGGDAVFPEGANIEFAQVLSPNRIALRVWERGSGETLACGTGAAAAVAVAHAAGTVETTVTVVLPGGELRVGMDEGSVWIAGPARVVYRGSWPDSG
ncbi:MAG: diaminopimelate epimerase [Acidimicrobiia bacterium]